MGLKLTQCDVCLAVWPYKIDAPWTHNTIMVVFHLPTHLFPIPHYTGLKLVYTRKKCVKCLKSSQQSVRWLAM